MNEKVSQPVIYKTEYSLEGIKKITADQIKEDDKELLLEYPTVYIIDADSSKKYVYVGETTNIEIRTLQHLNDDGKKREDWKRFNEIDNKQIYVIGHDRFNKSLTLDIENKLMLYLTSVDSIDQLINRKTNPQGKYYPADLKDRIFSKIWQRLTKLDKTIFPSEKIIRDSAIFKSSPFHDLTSEQKESKLAILHTLEKSLKQDEFGQLILVEGEAGSGKTVLLSTLFFEICQKILNEGDNKHAALIVNHEQQVKVYKTIMSKLGMLDSDNFFVGKPTPFLNYAANGHDFDVVLIDESHLLLTRKTQGYHGHGSNQLKDVLQVAKSTIAVFDERQVLSTESYISQESIEEMREFASTQKNLITLTEQLRMSSGPEVQKWIRDFVWKQRINTIPDDKDFKIEIFDNIQAMQDSIVRLNQDKGIGLSRLVATFDWQYSGVRQPDDKPYWDVEIGDWKAPWNLQLPSKTTRRNKADIPWAEREETINEIGSTFTVQGFDLNYVGVILGPSVIYRDGKVQIDSSKSMDRKVTSRRTVGDKKIDISENLIKNEIYVLLTRGVHGLFIYAVDSKLRKALLNAQVSVSELPLVAEAKNSYYLK